MCCNCSEYLILAQAPNFRYSFKCLSEKLNAGCGAPPQILDSTEWALVITHKREIFFLENMPPDQVGFSASYGKPIIGRRKIISPDHVKHVLPDKSFISLMIGFWKLMF